MSKHDHKFSVGDKVHFTYVKARLGRGSTMRFTTVYGIITAISDSGVATIKPHRSRTERTCHVSNLRLESERTALTDSFIALGKGV